MFLLIVFLFSIAKVYVLTYGKEDNFSFLILMDYDQKDKFEQEVLELINSETESRNIFFIEIDYGQNDFDRICNHINGNAIPLIIDLSWLGSELAEKMANVSLIPYVSVELSIGHLLNFLDVYMDKRNAKDVVVIFDEEFYLDQSIYYWSDTPKLRSFIVSNDGKNLREKLEKILPYPTVIAIIANSRSIQDILKNAEEEKAFRIPERVIIIFSDLQSYAFNYNNLMTRDSFMFFRMHKEICCLLQEQKVCACPEKVDLQTAFLKHTLRKVLKIFLNESENFIDNKIDYFCKSDFDNNDNLNYDYYLKFKQNMQRLLTEDNFIFDKKDSYFEMEITGIIERFDIEKAFEIVGFYKNSQIISTVDEENNFVPYRNFYRIGIYLNEPWAYQKIDPVTKEEFYAGYCVELIEKISKLMNFDYELVLPVDGKYGRKDEFGEWNGLIGQIVRGEIDIIVADIIMTASREEVVDFVAPYFEEDGITIVMRKPVRKTSLFKFMTVLKLEVWLCILAALTLTAFMIWFIDKYSPYSGKNYKHVYGSNCRDFTLKESFWFALTSFTPQGGGEAPKSFSGRTLVAAYWLFVVLMLATFTANLAAFLTVERMQTPVQSLEQLARQSRINYTVVDGSQTHQYFINMKNAEDTLYRMWKELTLNASPDEEIYRVWDYPIKEQYGRILTAINDSNPVKSPEEGFRKVNERTEADFAFIHNSAEIKFAITKNCNFTEVGEVFAHKHYAIIIQQGSNLMDDISLALLELQKDRVLEFLKQKYWNNSLQENCSNSDDSEGITLDSLGGVFIATLFGLALAMVTLVGEVLYYKIGKKPNLVQPRNRKNQLEKHHEKFEGNIVTIGKTMKLLPNRSLTPQISYIPNVYPRNRFAKYDNN